MRYWLTIHYPNLKHEDPISQARPVYLQDKYEGVGKGLRIGDLVLVYETKWAKRVPGEEYWDGRQGVIAIARVSGPMERRNIKATRYEDSEVKHWAYKVPTELVSVEGFVSLDEVNELVPFGSGNRMRIASGLVELTPTAFEKVKRRFEAYGKAKLPRGYVAGKVSVQGAQPGLISVEID